MQTVKLLVLLMLAAGCSQEPTGLTKFMVTSEMLELAEEVCIPHGHISKIEVKVIKDKERVKFTCFLERHPMDDSWIATKLYVKFHSAFSAVDGATKAEARNFIRLEDGD